MLKENKSFIASVICLLVALGILLTLLFYKSGAFKKSNKQAVAVESTQEVARTDLTPKEETKLKQFSTDMLNDYNLTVQNYYIVGKEPDDCTIHVTFSDSEYLGEITYDKEKDRWIAKLIN